MRQGLPHIYKTLAKLAQKMMQLTEESDKSSSSDSELDDDDYEKALNKLSAMRAKNEKKEAGKGEGKEDVMGDEAEDDSGEDFSIEDSMQKEAGDFELSYSPLDAVNELYYVKTRLEGELVVSIVIIAMAQKDMGLYKQLDAALTEEERKNLNAAMVKAEEYQKEINEANASQ